MKTGTDFSDRLITALVVLPELERRQILLSLSTEEVAALVEMLAADCAERVRMQARLHPDIARHFTKLKRK